MEKVIKPNGKHKRSPKGAGRLYKRDTDGAEHPADWQGAGAYWLAYSMPNPKGGLGQRVRVALRDADGNQITDRKTAEAERRRILAPYQTGDAVETLKAVQARLVDASAEHAAAIEAAKEGITIRDAWTRYVANPTRPDAGAATIRQYGFQWGRFASWLAREHPAAVMLADIGRDVAQAYAADLAGAGLSANSFNKHTGLLKLVFRVLADDAGLTANPFERIERKNLRTAERRELTTEEMRRIIETASGETRLLFAVGVYTGLRLGDCCTLRWSEVDLIRGFIVRIPNKTASSGRPVRIPLFRGLATMLQEAKETARGEYVLPRMAASYLARGADKITRRIQRHFFNCGIDCHAPGTGDQIKRDELGNPVLTEKGNVVLEPTGKRAVLRCGFHSLRHSFVSLCREANAPLSVVEAIVGHTNPAMSRHYTHTGDAEATRAVASLPEVTGTTPPGTVAREALPEWARALVGTITAKNWKAVKAALLEVVNP